MTNSEIINAYLDNELTAEERQLFESRLNSEPGLQQELRIHENIIEGTRDARKAELKQRLNRVDVGGHTGWSAVKIISTLAIVTAGALAVYFLYPESAQEDQPAVSEVTEEPVKEEIRTDQTEAPESMTEQAEAIEEEIAEETPEAEVKETIERATPESEQEEVTRQPEVKRPVVAPTFESTEMSGAEVTAPDGAVLEEAVTGESNLDVTVVRNMPDLSFHYAFENGTLKLYGDFDSDLYEILEFNSNKGKRWFLCYQGSYYGLDASANGVQPLREIKDNKLLDVLQNIR